MAADGAKGEARKLFTMLAARADVDIDVAEAALLIAKEEYPQLDVPAYLAQLDAMAESARTMVLVDTGETSRVARLNYFLFVRQGFRGNKDDYFDPRNSYLNEVLERRTGIPITLGIVYAEVGRRLGLPLFGVGFPGHFLVKHAGDRELIIDPFTGGIIDAAECARRYREFFGPRARFDLRLLRPAANREILRRILANLKQIFVERQDWPRALSCLDRMLLLAPDAAPELRERGLLYYRLECFAAALQDLERYLRVAPSEDKDNSVRGLVPALRRQVAHLH
jgi:regulator of sirC expression with transglutaminase-like and TPR domain